MTMLHCHRSKAHTGSCCIMMNPQSPQIVIDSDAQLRISNNELLSPARVTSQPLRKLPSPTVHSYNRHSPPQPPPQLDFTLIGRGPVISAWIAWQPPSSWSNYAGSILGPLWPQEGFIRLSNWPWPDLQHLPPLLIESGRCLYTENWYLIDWPRSWAEDYPSECQWWKMECASPPSLINTPLGPDSIKWGVHKHRACCHCSGPLGTGFQLQQRGLGPSHHFIVLPLLSPPLLFITHDAFQVASFWVGLYLFSTLTFPPIASLHGSKSIITVWAWLTNIFPIPFLNRIFGTAYLFWVPNGDSGYLCKCSIRQLRCWSQSPSQCVKWLILIGVLNHPCSYRLCLGPLLIGH